MIPAEQPEWVRQDIYLLLAAGDPTGVPRADSVSSRDSVRHRLPVEAVGLVLQELAPYFRARAALPTAAATAPPSGESRYTPAALFTDVRFVLRGNGVLDTVYIATRGDSTFAADLVATVRAAAAEQPLLLTGDSAARLFFFLSATTISELSGVARWRAFSLLAPRFRPAAPGRTSPRMAYPDGLNYWEASIILQFVIEADGHVKPETIRSLNPAPGYVWESESQRLVFERFLDQVRATISRWRYQPAEVAGCRVRQLVQQRFDFRVP